MYQYLITGIANVFLLVRGKGQGYVNAPAIRYRESISHGFSRWYACEEMDCPWQ